MCYTSVCRVWLSVVSVYGAVAANDLVAWRGGERWSVGAPLVGFAYCDANHRAATCDENAVRLVDSDMFCEDLHEIIVPDFSQGMLDRISWTADGSVLSISDKNGSLFSYAMRCVENQSKPSLSLMSIATGPAAAVMRLMSEPISFQRIVFTLIVAGVVVLCMTAHGMETQPGTFIRAVLGLSQVI